MELFLKTFIVTLGIGSGAFVTIVLFIALAKYLRSQSKKERR